MESPLGEKTNSFTDRSVDSNRVRFDRVARLYRSRYQRSDSNPGRRCARIANVFPSGENTGCVSAAALPAVIFLGSPPVEETSQTSRFVFNISRSRPSRFETKATEPLSGLNVIALSS